MQKEYNLTDDNTIIARALLNLTKFTLSTLILLISSFLHKLSLYRAVVSNKRRDRSCKTSGEIRYPERGKSAP